VLQIVTRNITSFNNKRSFKKKTKKEYDLLKSSHMALRQVQFISAAFSSDSPEMNVIHRVDINKQIVPYYIKSERLLIYNERGSHIT